MLMAVENWTGDDIMISCPFSVLKLDLLPLDVLQFLSDRLFDKISDAHIAQLRVLLYELLDVDVEPARNGNGAVELSCHSGMNQP